MADVTPIIEAFINTVNQRVTTKDTVNSIEPVDVGGSITDLADLLIEYLNSINNFAILYGTIPPNNANGVDNDEYHEFGATYKIYKKNNGTWVLRAAGDFGVNIVDGNINLQSSVNGTDAFVSSGQWGINNVIYTKALQSSYPIPVADVSLDRIDAIFADSVGSGTVYYVAGIASANPDLTKPVLPADNIIVTYVYVPNSSSGYLPYISDSNVPIFDGSPFAKLHEDNVFTEDNTFEKDLTIGKVDGLQKFININGSGVSKDFGIKLNGAKRFYDNTDALATTIDPDDNELIVIGNVDLIGSYQFKINGVPIGGGSKTILTAVTADSSGEIDAVAVAVAQSKTIPSDAICFAYESSGLSIPLLYNETTGIASGFNPSSTNNKLIFI